MYTNVSRIPAAVAAAALAATLLAAPASAQPTITCDYRFNSWRGGFSADLIISNSGPTIDGWVARWSFDTPTVLGSVWSAIMWQPEPGQMVASNVSYNRVIPSGGAIAFGWTASAPAAETPTDITVNGTPC